MQTSTVRAARRGLVAVVLLALTACGGTGTSATPDVRTSTATTPLRGTVPPRPYALPALHLTDQDGRARDLRPGRDVLLFFGYTHCPDECPTTMADAAQALRDAPAQAEQTTVVFVSSDPHRDTPARLASWLHGFAWPASTQVVGLTGPFPAVQAAGRALDVPLEPPVVTSGDYEVAHGTQLIGFDRTGRARALWLTGTPPADITHDLPLLDAPAVAAAQAAPSPSPSFVPAITVGGLQLGDDRALVTPSGATVDLAVRSTGDADQLQEARLADGGTVTGGSGQVPAHGLLRLQLQVTARARPLVGGDVLPLVLRFARQGQVVLQVPVTGGP